jgi:hypothetical protein
MRQFEYRAIPAPNTGTKAKGVKSREDRFALSMTDALNEMATDGWEYVRAEMLPVEERKGLTGTQKSYQNILIFRRLKATPLALDESPRVRSVPAPSFDDAPPANDAPTRLVSTAPEESTAPPLGAATDKTG